MNSLYLFFIKKTALRLASSFPIVVISIWALNQLGVSTVNLFVGYAVLPLVMFIGLSVMHVSVNLSWLLGLPLRKTEIVFLNFILNVSNGVLVFLWWIAIYVASNLLVHHSFPFSSLLQMMESLSGLIDGLNKLLMNAGVQGFIVMTLVVEGAGLLFLCPVRAVQRGTQSKPLIVQDPKTQKIALAGMVVLGTLGYIFWSYVETKFFIFSLISFGLLAGLPAFVVLTLGISGSQKRRWMRTSYAVIALQVFGAYGYAMLRGHSSEVKQQVDSLQFLGPWAGTYSEEKLAGLIQSDLPYESLQSLSVIYLSRFSNGKRIPGPMQGSLSLRRAVFAQSRYESVTAAFRMFKIDALSCEDISQIFIRYSEVVKDGLMYRVPEELLDAKCSTHDIVKFLGSKEPVTIYYGLLWSRYHRESELIPVIWSNIVTYPEEMKNRALLTLSILRGTRVGFDDYSNYRVTRKANLELGEADCSLLTHKTIKNLNRSDEGVINICIRKLDSNYVHSRIRAVEDQDWIDWPFNYSERAVMKKWLGLVD